MFYTFYFGYMSFQRFESIFKPRSVSLYYRFPNIHWLSGTSSLYFVREGSLLIIALNFGGKRLDVTKQVPSKADSSTVETTPASSILNYAEKMAQIPGMIVYSPVDGSFASSDGQVERFVTYPYIGYG